MSKTLHLSDFAGVELLNDDGKLVRLSDLIGTRVLIFFFPRADTPGCTTQACGFRDTFPRIQEAGATVIGISTDAPADLAKWKQKEHLPYMLISDPDHRIADAFGAWGEKTNYGKKYFGVIRSHFIFDAHGALEQAMIKVTPQDSIQKGTETLLK